MIIDHVDIDHVDIDQENPIIEKREWLMFIVYCSLFTANCLLSIFIVLLFIHWSGEPDDREARRADEKEERQGEDKKNVDEAQETGNDLDDEDDDGQDNLDGDDHDDLDGDDNDHRDGDYSATWMLILEVPFILGEQTRRMANGGPQ